MNENEDGRRKFSVLKEPINFSEEKNSTALENQGTN